MSAIVRRLFSVAILLAILVVVRRTEADVCVYKPPKVNRACGAIVDPAGRPIPNVNVSVLKDGAAVKTDTTDDAGEFDFGEIQSGKYELDAAIAGFQHARYQLTISKPTDSCKHAMEIRMAVGGQSLRRRHTCNTSTSARSRC